jgi:hypothetical protein
MKGTPAEHTIPVSGAGVAFGAVRIGSNKSQNIAVTNTGSSAVTISGVTVAGARFTASGILSATTLTPSRTAMLNLVFAPASVGRATGSVTIVSKRHKFADGDRLDGHHTFDLSFLERQHVHGSHKVYLSHEGPSVVLVDPYRRDADTIGCG